MTSAARVAFDRLAPTYDAMTAGETFQLQRRQTHAALARWIRPGFRVLEIGCGTGVDTEFLARLGARVVACDPSDEMLSRTQRRLTVAGLGDRAGILSCGLQELPHFLDALDHAEGFDAIVSNFGALNCAPTLDALGLIGRNHLRAGGAMAIGLIGRTCLWETLYFSARGDRARAARRRVTNAAVAVAGINVPTYFHRSSDLALALGEDFTRDTLIGIGVFVPPPYLEPRWRQLPGSARRMAAAADRVAGSWPLVNQLGDHTLSRWVKRRAPRVTNG
ncbi:MAG TPA: methyltransferase domain-containing protein [Vicinamibacterales bacterium]|nr:methyltransferase domain-containing protein [Vicinamibacterales bacterium]